MNATHRAIIALAPTVGRAWVASRRRRYRRMGRELTREEVAALEPFFDAALLARVRIAQVQKIEPPIGVSLARRLGLGSRLAFARLDLARLDLSWVRGMAFDDAIVIAGAPPSHSLLFHELVHVVQYELFGVGPMLSRYVRDYFETGSDYFAITAERCAYELQARFDAAPTTPPTTPFSVRDETRRYFEPSI